MDKKNSEMWDYFKEELKRINDDISCGNYTGASFSIGHLYTLAGRYTNEWKKKEGE